MTSRGTLSGGAERRLGPGDDGRGRGLDTMGQLRSSEEAGGADSAGGDAEEGGRGHGEGWQGIDRQATGEGKRG